MTNETTTGMRSANAPDGGAGAGRAAKSSKSGAAPRAAHHSGVVGKATEASWPHVEKGGSVGVGKGAPPSLNSADGTYGDEGATTPDDSGSGASFGATLAAGAKTKPKAKSKGPVGRGRPGRPVKLSRFRGVTKTSGSSYRP